MKDFCRAIRYDCYNFYLSKSWWIVCSIVIILQPLLAFLEGKSIAQIGPDATPETHPELIEAIGQVDYLGFDALSFGLVAIVIFGTIVATSEFKQHELRTTFLSFSHRLKVFIAKIVVLTLNALIMASLSIIATITMVHLGLGKSGLPLLTLSPIAWQFIGYAVCQWVLLILFTYGLAVLFRNAIVPAILMLPQIVGLGEKFTQSWDWGNYLPVIAGNRMITSPDSLLSHEPWEGGLVLTLWTASLLILAAILFSRRDIGGNY